MSHRPSLRLFAALAAVLLLVCVFRTPFPGGAGDIQITAHRGCSVWYPENTMAAFRAAADLGADCIELDVQQTRDRIFIVCHDQTLSRTAGTDRTVSSMSYADIAALDAGSWFSGQFQGEPIPTLESVLQFAKNRPLTLNIELKSADASGETEADLAALIRRYGMEDQCLVAAQDYRVLIRLKECAPELRTLYVTWASPRDPAALDCADEISVALDSVTAELVEQVHCCGKRLHIWTVDTAAQIQKAAALHPDSLITDDPALARSLLDR